MSNEGKQVYRWTHAQWHAVMRVAHPLLEAGAARFKALAEGQKELPKAERYDDHQLLRLCRPAIKTMDHAIERYLALPPEERNPPPVEPGPWVPREKAQWATPDYTREDGHAAVRWKPHELALMVRRVKHWQAAGSTAGIARLFGEAQEVELPPERRRSRQGLSVKTEQYLAPHLSAKSVKSFAPLIEHIPFDPLQREYYPPGSRPPPAADAELIHSQGLAAAEAQEALEAPEATTPADTSPPPVVAPPGPIPEAAAPATPPAPPPPSTTTAAHEAARWFGISLANALVPMVETMLTAHEQSILAKVNEQQRAQGDQLAKDMSAMLLKGLDEMLGGSRPADNLPVVETPQPQAEAQPELQPELQPEELVKRKRIRIDVVGFEQGGHNMLVQRMLNGQSDLVDLNFIGPDTTATYAPHRDRHVIILTQRIPHSLRDKIKASGCKPHYVARSPGRVAEEIKSILKQQYGDLAASSQH